ncbi:MAG: hypothetical protein FWD57_00850, partial [Polyangiaceae bacterium]|nr:hypothetical protein [Polyangiaceae bacterium]
MRLLSGVGVWWVSDWCWAICGGRLRAKMERANCETMWCSRAAQENRVDATVGAGFKPAYITAALQNSPDSPISVVLQLAHFRQARDMARNQLHSSSIC